MKKNVLLEGLYINEEINALSWVDIENNNLFFRDLVTNHELMHSISTKPSNVFYFDLKKALILDDSGISHFDRDTGCLTTMICMKDLLRNRHMRGNDGVKLSPEKYLLGSMSIEDPAKKIGAVWLLEKNKITQVSENHIPNLFLVLKNKVLVADSMRKVIYSHSFSSGVVEGIWSDLSHFDGEPDGGCLSEEGFIYIALWGEGAILKLDQEGQVLATKAVPFKQPSNCKAKGNKLFITSATVGLSNEDIRNYPRSGSLYSMDLF